MLALCTTLVTSLLAVQEPVLPEYVPARGEWGTRPAEELGFDGAALAAAAEFAQAAESEIPLDLARFIEQAFAREMHNDIVGPTAERARQNGMIVVGGYIAAEWGDTRRPDMTFSVTKTYLSTVVGLAVADGRIAAVQDPVSQTVRTPHFEGERHGSITWDHLLRQTSDWRGDLWGKPSWADRPPRGEPTEAEQRAVPLREPGEAWEYNDVCVNLLAFAAMQVWRKPLPQVLAERVMDPIGASPTWRWHGYSTSWVTLDGLQMQSVSGGGHHGGGMFVSTRDQARFGLLCLRNGAWGDEQLVLPKWIEQARTPTDVRPDYGYMNWFLNAERVGPGGEVSRVWPAAPASAVCFRGAGSNLVYLDSEADLMIVLRWFQAPRLNELLELVYAGRRASVTQGR